MATPPEFQITGAKVWLYRAPTDPPVRTSFGIMHERPALLIQLTDADGNSGWGEVWCNFPTVGAEHRARLFASVFAPMVCAQPWRSAQHCFETLTANTHILAIQSGEPGPLAQLIAAVDVAVWDLIGKRAGLPLWKLFGGQQEVAVYASGINPESPVKVAEAKAAEGHTAFKIKVGFDDDLDERNVREMRQAFGDHTKLMVDANQAWDPARAATMIERLAPYELTWLEEPIPADNGWSTWRGLAEGTAMSLAAGENLRGIEVFSQATTEGGIQVIQPDIGKWGGFTGCLEVGRTARQNGAWFCPHWLGAGVGLQASMHLKAAIGGPGFVEVDANPNPLREYFSATESQIHQGKLRLSDAPGLGIEPQLDAARPFLIEVQGV